MATCNLQSALGNVIYAKLFQESCLTAKRLRDIIINYSKSKFDARCSKIVFSDLFSISGDLRGKKIRCRVL